jgi:hypothetical protein
VIFILGEIDCREGICSAVERDYYETIEEAIVATIQLFIKVLKDLKKTRKFKVKKEMSNQPAVCSFQILFGYV